MAETEAFPEFGSAYPVTAIDSSTQSASWNPAFRQDNVDRVQANDGAPESDDDFFERYPGSTPRKQQQATQLSNLRNDSADADALDMRRQSISVEQVVDIKYETASPRDLTRGAYTVAEVEAPISHHNHAEDEEGPTVDDSGEHDEENAIFIGPDETIQEQERDLDERMPDLPAEQPSATQEMPDAIQQQDHAHTQPAGGKHSGRPEDRYEHQGEVTAMEAAQDEEPDAPLLDDEQEPPTAGPVSKTSTMQDQDAILPVSTSSDTQSHPPSMNRSFTTNFTDPPQGAAPSSHEEWPGASDDQTFGELLDDNQRQQPRREKADEQWPEVGDNDFDALANAPPKSVNEDTRAQGLGEDTMSSRMSESRDVDKQDLAAAWQAALDDDDLLDESNELDPSRFFGEDDEGLLDDDSFLSEPAQTHAVHQQKQQQPQNPSQHRSPNAPASYQPPYPAANQFVSQTQAHSRAAGTPETGLYDMYGAQSPTSVSTQPQKPSPQVAQSFVDKAKGGYQSPYDLPMEVVKPVRRRQQQQQQQQGPAPAPPPRSSSFSQAAPPAGTPRPPSVPPSVGSAGSAPPSRDGPVTAPASAATGSARNTPKTDSGFFADLPIAAKPRARPSQIFNPPALASPPMQQTKQLSGYAPQGLGPRQLPPVAGPQAQPSQSPAPATVPRQEQPPQPTMYGGLRQPERMPLLPEQPSVPVPTNTANLAVGATLPTRYSPTSVPAPTQTSRYSPAPPTHTLSASLPAATSTSRYSPAPTAQPTQSVQPPPTMRHVSASAAVHQYAPRTSSPLAGVRSFDKPQPPLPPEAMARGMTGTPPMTNGVLPSAGVFTVSPERKGTNRYSPSDPAIQPQPGRAQPPPPPQRPRTQSPVSAMKPVAPPVQRYGSLMQQPERPTSAPHPNVPQASNQLPSRSGPVLPHRRTFSREVTFAPPTDPARAADPLERWKGSPLFSWNAAGMIVTTFPRRTQFFGAGGIPSVKCTPGDVRVQEVGSVLSMDETTGKFPGPLPARAKGKKKEVLAWMSTKIAELEQQCAQFAFGAQNGETERKRLEEKIILWKIVRVMVTHDGLLEQPPTAAGGRGDGKLQQEVREILLPDLAQMGQVMELSRDTSSTAVSAGGAANEPIDRSLLLQLRQLLLEGHRDRAVWLAEEKKLWGHAMLLASTMGNPDIWKQVVQSFVRSQVKSVAATEGRGLAALYQVFAGNVEEVVDEIVPPSARAGFRMVSKTDEGPLSGGGSTGLEGLDQWRETLGLVTSNRTPGDSNSLLALGKLLKGYGRFEAADVCFLFAGRGAGGLRFGGVDDAEADVILLGGHENRPLRPVGAAANFPPATHMNTIAGAPFGHDLDAILLTEIYEWASSLSAPSTTPTYLPHLQPFKLMHSQILALYGHKSKAQAYCDHITQAYQSTTRPSPYYHPPFTQAVAELSAYLSQSPQSDGKSGGWFGRPSTQAMKSVSSNAGSWFTKFVSGDEDQQSQTGNSEETGPFGRVSGEVSRSGSVTDLYGALAMGGGGPVSTPPSTGYGPTAFSPTSQPQGRYAPGYSGGAAATASPLQKPLPEHRYTPQLSTGLSPVDGSALTSPTEVTRNLGVPSLDTQQQRPVSAPRSASASRYAPASAAAQSVTGLGVQNAALNVPRPDTNRTTPEYGPPYGASLSDSRRGSAQDPGSQGSYQPSPSLAQEPSPYAYQQQHQPPAFPPLDDENGTDKQANGVNHGPTDEDGLKEQNVASGGYEPPTSGYEPPSYEPYQPEPQQDEDDVPAPKSKKKGIMDLDDDDDAAEMERRAATLKKAQADREADEAFRKAAEADAARDKNVKGPGHQSSGSWFGGWFKKDPTAELNKPIKAKLGEENSFYYDEKLKKWVNKKAGPEDATPAAATPPPPRGGPMNRAVSVPPLQGPPMGPPSRVGSGVGSLPSSAGFPPHLAGSGPPSRAGTPASVRSAGVTDGGVTAASAPPGLINGDGSSPASAPPSRPATSMSTASDLDDLLAAGPRKGGAGGTVKKGKKGRYVDVMAK